MSFLIADLSGRALVRLTHVTLSGAPEAAAVHDHRERATVLPLDGGPAEQALRSQQVQVLAPDEGPWWTLLAPVTERGEALGLLELDLPREPDADVVDAVRRTAHVLCYVVIASRRHADLYEWGQRSTPFSLSAEVQRRLLPAAFTCEAGSFTLAAWFEPAETIAGDTFDYSLGRDQLHLSVTDAVGHGVGSALTATLCVGSLRNTRRHGATLLEQAMATNAALSAHTCAPDGESFATALLGDRVVVVTDGMLERAAASVDLEVHVRRTRDLHPREATREVADLVIEACGGTLADDAALLVLDWHGGHDRPRTTVAGADVEPRS